MTARPVEDTAGLERLSRDVGLQLTRISQWVTRATNTALEPHGMRVPQYAVLLACSGPDGTAQRELASVLVMAPSQVANVVGELERAGLVSRTLDPQDARAFRVRTTAEGTGVLEAAAGAAQEAGMRLLSGLNDSERHAFLGLLQRLSATGLQPAP